MRHLIATLSLATVWPMVAASAQATDAAARTGQPLFDRADTDQDGLLSLEEWKAIGRREKGFRLVDADHDGKVTPDEIRAAMAHLRRNGVGTQQ